MSKTRIADGDCASEQPGVPGHPISQSTFYSSDGFYTLELAIELSIGSPDLQASTARPREPAMLVLESIKYG